MAGCDGQPSFFDSESATHGKGQRRAVLAAAVFISLVCFAMSGGKARMGLQLRLRKDESIGAATSDSIFWGHDILIFAPEPGVHRGWGCLLIRGLRKGKVGIGLSPALLIGC